MAINKAIIQVRRGLKDDLQLDKLLPGELAIATDAPCMWFCWSVGNVEQLPTSDNIDDVIKEVLKKYLEENPVVGISEIYMRVSEGYIQYSSDNETWENVIATSELKGEKGEKGDDGGYYTPDLDDDGNLSWTGSEEGMPEVTGKNIKGPEGVGIKEFIIGESEAGTNFYTVTIKLTNGEETKYDILQGTNGEQGVGIKEIRMGQSSASGAANLMEIYWTDGEISLFHVWNGKAGKTPVKGTDYYTDADKQEMVGLVLEALPADEFVKTAEQTLTAEQQLQARSNIGAASAAEVSQLSQEIVDLKGAGYVKQAEMEAYINETFLGGEW